MSPVRNAARRPAVALVLTSAASLQVGAAVGATLFPLVGPFGVAAMRQVTSAIVLGAVVRPPLQRIGLRRLAPAILLGVVLVGMNLALYGAVERIGLGLAVTVEFLGPLAVALLGARRRRDALVALLALAGVAALAGAFGGPAPDAGGLALGLAAAALWAAYILLSERAGALPGLTGTAVAAFVGTVLTLPVLVVLLAALPGERLLQVLAVGAAVGLLSSALPYSLDLVVLRRLPRAVFGMLQSAHPVAAALFGLLVLGQHLDLLQVAGVAAVCGANVLALSGRPAGPPPA